MKKFAILVGLMGLALLIGLAGTSFHQNGKAEANATDLIAFNPDVCAGLTHLGASASPVPNPCYSLDDPRALAEVAAFYDGNVDDASTYKDLVDASNAQLGEKSAANLPAESVAPATAPLSPAPALPVAAVGPNSQAMWVLTFVSNDDPISLTAEQGVWLHSDTPATDTTTPKSTFTGCPQNPTTYDEVGAVVTPVTAAAEDADCDGNSTTGDGVVVDLLYSGTTSTLTPNALDRGSATIEAFQSTDTDTQNLDYTVVGVPNELSLKSLKDTIQEESNAPCVLGGYSTNEFTQENALPDVSGMLATVTDDDGNDLTGLLVSWQSSDTSDIFLAGDGGPNPLGTGLGLTPTLFKSDQASAPELACGGDAETGIKIKAAVGIDDFNGNAVINGVVTPIDTLIDDHLLLDVVSAPASMTLAADPTSITCDGVTSSTVTATLLGSDSKPVVTGNTVRFDVVALGTANPITAVTDANGTASTKVTPLSGVTAGVTADVTVRTVECNTSVDTPADCFDGSDFLTSCLNPCKTESNTQLDNLESTILVSCQPAAPPVAPPPVVVPPSVSPPKTGDGGYLP